MGLKTYSPSSPSRRGMTGYDFSEITKSKPEKSLTRPITRSGGRSNSGQTSMWRKSGNHKRNYRLIDF